MAIFAVPLGMPVKKPFVTTLKARGSAAFSHEAEDLVVFSPHLYKIGCSDKLVRHARPTRINLTKSPITVIRPIRINLTQSSSPSVGARVVRSGGEGLYGRPRPVPRAHLWGNALTPPPGHHRVVLAF